MSRQNRTGSRSPEPKSLWGSIAIFGLTVCLMVGVKACDNSGPNAENSYRVRAVVDELNDDSFHIVNVQIIEAHGSAKKRLEDGEDVHDNFKSLGCLGSETSNDFDKLIEEDKLKLGSVVEVEATVGESYYDCGGKSPGFSGPRSLLEHLEVLSQ